MNFASIVGQTEIKKRLCEMVQSNRIPHALLFHSTEGTGGLPLSIAFAKYLMCNERTTNDSCNKCPSCQKINKLIHPDLHFVFPVINPGDIKNAVSDYFLQTWRNTILENPYINLNIWIETIASENKQGNIFEAESNKIIEKLLYKPFESDYKIMIIWMAEKMNTHCANKLLKIIEEPPNNTIFILISDDTSRILPTIRSRCQQIVIPPIDAESLAKVLQNQYNTISNIHEVVRLAHGNYLKAIQIIQKNDEEKLWLEHFIKLMRMAFKVDIIGLIEWSSETAGFGRERQKRFLHYCLRMIRENFASTIASNSITYMTTDEMLFSKNFHTYVHESNVKLFFEQFEKAIFQIEHNGNAKIIFLDIALQICRILKIKPIAV